MLPQLLRAFHFAVTSFSGSTLCPMGIVQCLLKIEGHSFKFNFIACKNLNRPIILGLDFMCKHHIGLSWSETRKRLLTLENKVLADAINICEMGSQLMTCSNIILPPRMLAIVSFYMDLKENSTEHTYKVRPNGFLMDQYPNMLITPVIHITLIQSDTTISVIIINPSTKPIFLVKCEVLGFLDKTDIEICEIMTSSALELLALDMTAEQPEDPLPYREGQFICSPADITVHREVDLQDAKVNENI